MSNNCRLVGLGIVNGLGSGCSQVREGLLSGSQCGMQETAELIPGRTLVVARAPEAPPLPDRCRKWDSPTARLGAAALEQIREVVEQYAARFGRSRIGLIAGSSTSGIAVGEAAMRKYVEDGLYPSDYHYSAQEPGAVAAALAAYLEIGGPAYTVSTACSSGAKALSSARGLLEMGCCDAVVAGGVDALCGLTLNGFASLGLVSQSVCNPFSRNRSGINIGEGAAFFLIAKEPGGVQLLGCGESSAAHHISQPDPQGRGVERAVKQALQSAGLEPSDINYINLHGTATIQNDLTESIVVNRIFGTDVPCSSTKPLVGHTLGAAGAVEAGFCWLLLNSSESSVDLPPHRWDGAVDENCAPLLLVEPGQRLNLAGPAAALSSSFAFGGSNCVVIMGRS